MARFRLAQVNIGRIRARLESPIMEGFRSNATAIRPYPDDDCLVINRSVWEPLEARVEGLDALGDSA